MQANQPGRYFSPAPVPVPYGVPISPPRRQGAVGWAAGILAFLLVAGLITGLVFFRPQIIALLQGNSATGSSQTNPSQGTTQQTTPPPAVISTTVTTQQITPSPTQVDVAGALSVVSTFCEYVNSGAVQMAYNLTSQNYQNRQSASDFANQFSDPDLFKGGCLYSNGKATSNGGVTVSLVWNQSHGFQTNTTNYTVTLIQGPQNTGWVIDSIVS